MLEYKSESEYIDTVNNNYILGNFKLTNSTIRIKGCNNYIILNNVNFKNTVLYITNDNNVFVAENTNINHVNPFVLSENVCCYVGKNLISGKTSVRVGETNMYIGNDVLLSEDICLRNNDGHCIYDIDSRDCINHGQPVIIGDHVWCGYHATLLKGTVIGSGSIVGACSLVNREFSSNEVIAGSPAKAIRHNVFWTLLGMQMVKAARIDELSHYAEDPSAYIFKEDTFVNNVKQIDASLIKLKTPKERAAFLLANFKININLN